MNYWNKVTEQAAERIKQGRESISNLQKQATTPPKFSYRTSQDDNGSRTPERLQSQSHDNAESEVESRSNSEVKLPNNEQSSELARMQQANKLLEAKIEMLRANLAAARGNAETVPSEDGGELQSLRTELQKATRRVSELQETSDLFKEQQNSAVQAAASLQKEMEESRAELVAAKAEIEDAGAANANLLAELEQAKQSVAENEQADESTQLQAELSSLRGKLDMMRKDLDLQSKDLEQSKAEVEELRTASSEMQQSRDSLKVQLDKEKEQTLGQKAEVKRLSELNATLKDKPAAPVRAEYLERQITQLMEDRASLESKVEEQRLLLEQQGGNLRRNSQSGIEDGSVTSPKSDQQATGEEDGFRDLGHSPRESIGARDAGRSSSSGDPPVSTIRRTIQELERASRARESASLLTNGSAPHHPRMDSIRSDSPHTPGSPPGPLKTMTSAPQPGGHLDDSSSNDTTLLSAEVKQLRSQLQIATEKWARDKQMFAEDAKELQRVSRARDQLAKQVAQLQTVIGQRQESSAELKEARDEIGRKDAALSSMEGQAAEFKKLQELLEGWETNLVSGKAESTGDSGSVLQQLSYRKAAMFALAKQAEASSAAASRSEKELKHSMARIKELKSQVGKERKQEKDQLHDSITEVESLRSRLQQERTESTALASGLRQELQDLKGRLSSTEKQHKEASQLLNKAEAEQARTEGAKQKLQHKLQEAESIIKQQETDVNSRDQQLAELNGQHAEQEKELASLRSEHRKVTKELRDRQGAVSEAKEKCDKLDQELQAAENRLKDQQSLEQQMASASSESNALQQKLASSESKATALEKKLHEAEASARESRQKQADLDQGVAALTSEAEELRQKLHNSTSESDHLRAEVVELKDRLDAIMSEQSDAQQAELHRLQAAMHTAERDANTAREASAAANSQLEELQKEVQNLTGMLGKRDAELRQKQDLYDTELAKRKQAEDRVDMLQTESDAHSCAQRDSEDARAAQADRLAVLEARILHSEEALERKEENLTNLEGFVVELQAELQDLRRQEAVANTSLGNLKSQNNELQHHLQQVQTSLDGSEKVKSEAEQTSARLSERIEHLEQQLQAATAVVSTRDQEKQDLSQQKANDEATCDNLRTQNGELQSRLERLQASLRDTEIAKSEVEEALTSLTEEVEGLKQQLQAATAVASASDKEKQEFRQQRADIEAACDNLKSQNSDLQHRLQQLQTSLDSLKQTQSEAAQTSSSLREEVGALKQQLDAARAAATASDKEKQELIHQKADKAAAIDNLSSQNTDLQHRLQKLQTSLDSLKQTKSEAEQTSSSLIEEVEALKQQLHTATAAASASRKEKQDLTEQKAKDAATCDNLRTQIEELQLRLQQLQNSIDNFNEAKLEAERVTASLSEVQEGLKQQLQAAIAASAAMDNEKQEAISQVKELQHQSKADKDKIAVLNAELSDLKSRLEESIPGSKAEQLESRNAVLQAELDAAKQNVHSLEEEADSYKGKIETYMLDREQLQRQTEAAESRLADMQSRESELQAESSLASKDAKQAIEQSQQLQQEKQLLQKQIQTLDETWQSERSGLKDKLERLQKSNRQRRQDVEDLKKQLASAQDMAAKGQQARDELMSAQQEIDRLSSALAAAEQTASEGKKWREEARRLESQHVTTLSSLKKQTSDLESHYATAERERDELLQEVALLKSASVAKDALQTQVSILTRDLDAAKEGLQESQKDHRRHEDLAQELRQSQAEAVRSSQLLAQVQQKQQLAEQQAKSVSEVLAEERKQRSADSKAFAADLEALASQDRSSWPASLQLLFQQNVQAAAEAAATSAQAQADAQEESLEAELNAAREELATASHAQQSSESLRLAAETRLKNLEAEMQDREAAFDHKLREQVERTRSSSEARCQDLEERVSNAERALEDAKAQAEHYEAACQAATKEIGEVKQRARALLEEKDAQLQVARSRSNISRAASLSGEMPLPLSSRISDRPASPSAEQLSELQPSHSSQFSPNTPMSPTASEIEPAAEVPGTKSPPRRTRLQAMQERIDLLEKELRESEHTHLLRDRAQEVAKAEIAELGRSKAREGLDADYLKAVILKGFETGELNGKSAMLPIIARLLHFSSHELHQAQNPRKIGKPARK